MRTYVVDASVALKWYLPEPLSDEAGRIRASDIQLYAPDFLWIEAASVLCRTIARKRLSVEMGATIFSALRSHPVRILPSVNLLDAATAIAVQTQTCLYDCLYVALAIRVKGKMVTADQKLLRALQRSRYAPHLEWVGDLV